MEKTKKEFEEYRMDLIYLNGDIICTSDSTGHSGNITDPNDDPTNPYPDIEGPDIFD